MTREACWRGRECSLVLGQGPGTHPRPCVLDKPQGRLRRPTCPWSLPRREWPLAPQRGSHPEGRRLFHAGPEGVETDISEGCCLSAAWSQGFPARPTSNGWTRVNLAFPLPDLGEVSDSWLGLPKEIYTEESTGQQGAG